MAGPVYLSRAVDHLEQLATTLSSMQGTDAVVSELIQNADDAEASRLRFKVGPQALEVWNDAEFRRCDDIETRECGWWESKRHRCDFHSFRAVAGGDKRHRTGTTGAFGIGFTAVYQLTDRPKVVSAGEHWILDEAAPEHERIQREDAPDGHTGTTFWLPWAFEPTEFRQRIRQDPISQDKVAGFPEELCNAVPAAMLFLQHLTVIEVVTVRPGVDDRKRLFVRTLDGDRLAVGEQDGDVSEWRLLVGDFAPEAEKLKASHPNLIDAQHPATVEVALPVRDAGPPGVLYATLPTKESTHLPITINAGFLPAPDRKRIRLDEGDAASDWNRAALRAAADVLSVSLEDLPGLIGDAIVADLLVRAQKLHRDREHSGLDPAFDCFWQSLLQRLPDAAVVPQACGGHGTPKDVRLWSDDAEDMAAGLLRELGVEMVDAAVRSEWFQLRGSEVGINPLGLRDVVAVLRHGGLDRRWTQADVDGGLATEDGLVILWRLLDRLLRHGANSAESRADLLDCAVVPGWDDALWPVREVRRSDQQSQDLFADLELDVAILDADRLGEHSPALAELVEDATPSMVLGWVEVAFAGGAAPAGEDRSRLLAWFHPRRDDLDRTTDYPRLAELPIFPTGTGHRPLTELDLPGVFDDPLGLAQVAQTRVGEIDDIKSFLRSLGARDLTFARYCRQHVPPAVRAGHLAEDKVARFMRLLADHLRDVRDDEEVHRALRDLALVQCSDGLRRPGRDVYLDDSVKAVVGDDVHIAAVPETHRSDHQDLFTWLGAALQPRPADVEARCQGLSSGPPDHREAAAAILWHLGELHLKDREHTERAFAALKTINWLPAVGRRTGLRPEALFATYRRHLFASQGTFLDVPLPVQQHASTLLEWLGVEGDPKPDLVVRHLLHCAENLEPVTSDMWSYLDQHHEDASLGQLKGRKCLLIADTGEYVKPAEVYWRENPFGTFRDLLGEEFLQHKLFLDRVGVREEPAAEDAIEVLRDVGADHGGQRAPLLAEHVPVVDACWRLLAGHLAAGDVTADTVAALRKDEVVLDDGKQLRRPCDVLFRDSEPLARRFGDQVAGVLVDRPKGQWTALEAAGVRGLSDAVTTRIIEQRDAEAGGVVAARLHARRPLMRRVLEVDAADAVDRLAGVGTTIVPTPLSVLTVQHELARGELNLTSDPYDAGAHLDLAGPDRSRLLYVERREEAPAWLAIARDLLRALRVDPFVVPSLTSVMKDLLAADTADDAAAVLDELRYPALHAAREDEAEPQVATGLGGSEVDHTEEEAAATETDPELVPDERDKAHEPDVPDDGASEAGTPRSQPAAGEQPTGTVGSAPGGLGSGGGGTGIGIGSSSGSRSKGSGSGSGTSWRQRLRSYVLPPRIGPSTTSRDVERDEAVEQAGIDAAMEYERRAGREPEEMPYGNPGYDIDSAEPGGGRRLIEVKATEGPWDGRGVAMSHVQFKKAQTEGDDFWLYVVEHAVTAPQLHTINDPAGKVDQYVFDGDWSAIADQADQLAASPRGLPELTLPTSPAGIDRATPVVDAHDPNATPIGWIECAHPDRDGTWYAVRIEGEALGLANRGGLAIVEPIDDDAEPDDGALVVSVLHDQVDPDTGRPVTIRRWHIEGAELVLEGDGSIEPLPVHHPDKVAVRGFVRSHISAPNLAAAGYLPEL